METESSFVEDGFEMDMYEHFLKLKGDNCAGLPIALVRIGVAALIVGMFGVWHKLLGEIGGL